MIRQFRQIASLLAASVVVSAQTSPIEKQAAAILQAKCLACHGAAKMADLDLRETPMMLKGGKRGPAVVPGNAEASLLFKAVKRDGELQMPPGKAPLTKAEVDTLRKWINSGAKLELAAKNNRAGRRGGRLRSRCARRFRPGPRRTQLTPSFSPSFGRKGSTIGAGGSPHFGSPRVLRPAWIAAYAGRSGSVRQRQIDATHMRS